MANITTTIRAALNESASASQDQRAALAMNLYKLLYEAEKANLSIIEKTQLIGLRKKAEAFIACVKQEYDEKVTLITELLKQPTYEDSEEGIFDPAKFDRNDCTFRAYMEKLAESLGTSFWKIRLRTDPLSVDDYPIFELQEIVYNTSPHEGWYEKVTISRPFGAKLWDFYLSHNGNEKWAKTILNCCGWPRELEQL